MDRIGNLSSGQDSRFSHDEERDNSASSSSDASVFGRTLWNTKDMEKPIFFSGSATQEQRLPPPVPLSSFNIGAVRTDTTNYHPLMLGEGAASVSTNISNTGEPQFNPLHISLPFIQQTPQNQVKIELFPTLESTAGEIPKSNLPPDMESAPSSSERKTGVKRKLLSGNFTSLSKQQRNNDRERERARREKAALNTLKEKLGENYLPSDQNPMKLTKVKALFGAIDYIKNLTELLAQDSPEHSDTLRKADNDNNDTSFMRHGMSPEFIDLSHLRGYERKKILDIGSGSGIIARRIRDELGCDVFAIEPGLEESNGVERDPFISSCNELGQNRVEKCTLQDASKNRKYQQAFEVVTVHNYNVNLAEKQDFLAALSKVIKPDGCVLIHTVEHERIIKTRNYEVLYLLDDLKLHFAEVSFERRFYQNGGDAIIRCTGPRNF